MDEQHQGVNPVKYSPEDYFLMAEGIVVDYLFAEVDQLSNDSIHSMANVFGMNLLAVQVTAESVWMFARKTAHSAAFLMASGINLGIHTAMMREGTPVPGGFEKAQERTRNDLEKPEWNQRFDGIAKNLAVTYLQEFLKAEPSRDAAMDTLRQCTVLTWSAFEVLCADLFRHLTNTKPKFAALLLKNDRTKKFYQPKDLILALEEHDYNLSCTMGDVLLGQCRLDNLGTIRVMYDVLFSDNEDLRSALNDERLWQLYQVRNLIVHRASVVDRNFVKNTGSDVPVGEKLRISPQQLKDFMLLAANAGMALLKAAHSTDATVATG